MGARLLLSLALVTACRGPEHSTVSILCARDRDCPSDCMECVDGYCREVAEPDCCAASECDGPGTCELAADAECIAGACQYAPQPCDDPPDDFCSNDDQIFYSHPSQGICDPDSGACAYPPTATACADCASTCLPACSQMRCDEDHGGCQLGGVCVAESTGPTCSYELAVDGTACALPTDIGLATSGVCDSGECTGCLTDADCADEAAFCNDPTATTDCQGTRRIGTCTDGSCDYAKVSDDSGCAGIAHACPDNLDPVACADAADQPPPVCPGGCTDDEDCIAGFVCYGVTCSVPCDAGDPCDDGNPCTYDDRCNGLGGCFGNPVTAHNGCEDDPGPCGAVRSCNGTSTCTVEFPGGETACNDGDPCTTGDACDGAGGCDPGEGCSGAQVCYEALGCFAAPTFAYSAPSWDLAGSGDLTWTVTGQPGAPFTTYDRRTSCSGSYVAGLSNVLSITGSYTATVDPTTSTHNCEGGSHGTWATYVKIADQQSSADSVTHYNSNCYSEPSWRAIHTAAAAASVCSACDDASMETGHPGDGCPPGEYCDVYSGSGNVCRVPSMVLTQDSVGGCLDFAEANVIGWRTFGPYGAPMVRQAREPACNSTWTDTAMGTVAIGQRRLAGDAVPVDNCATPENPTASCGYFDRVWSTDAGGLPCGNDTLGAKEWRSLVGDWSGPFRQAVTSTVDISYYNSNCMSCGDPYCGG
jgi:hypothetical protein